MSSFVLSAMTSWAACAALLISLFICPDSVISHQTTSCVATAACSPPDLAALRSMAAAFPPPLFTRWQLAGATAHNCCGHWGPLTINCSFCFTPNNSTNKHSGNVTNLEIDLISHYEEAEDISPVGIPSSLCSLSALTSLRLVGNIGNLVSGPIPDCIGNNLTHLVHLDLSMNSLTGSIPLSFSHLQSLQVLDLSVNLLSGAFPAPLISSHLAYLDLHLNSFSGPIPNPLNLTHLTFLDLSYNSFSGPIPNPLNLTHLTSLDLSVNAFSGPLPTLNTPKLVSLNLASNYISGSLSSLFQASNLTSLNSMSISDNQLTGVVPNFHPSHFSSLSQISLSGNLLGGSLPEISFCGLSNLSSLYLSSNAFSGQINTLEVCNFTKLVSIDMSANLFTGPFPDWVGSLSNLTDLSIAHNNLSGSLPNSWQNLNFLYDLDLSGNSILMSSKDPTHVSAPKLPCWLFALPKLKVLGLSSMGLQATDLAEICSSHCVAILGGHAPQLARLDLSNNLFNSEILHCFSKITVFEPPPPLGTWEGGEPLLNLSGNPLELDLSNPNAVKLLPKSLSSLDLSACRLRGQLTKLFFEHLGPFISGLYVARNYLQGHIPAELGCMSQIGRTVDLSNNNFTGVSPLINGGLVAFDQLYLSYNNLAGNLTSLLSRIVPNMSVCDDVFFNNLDLSHNFLTGIIPPLLFRCLSSYGTRQLKLNNNHLQGSIPSVPISLSHLRVLSLSNNQLSGQIPPSFRNLTGLLLLDLSHNKLEGNLDNISLFSSTASPLQFSELRVLLLGNNRFTGTIPTSLADIAPALQLIDFSNNSLTGSIPVRTLQSLPAFKIMYFPALGKDDMFDLDVVGGTLYEEFVINVKGNEEPYNYVLQALTSLDLSSNKLSGQIPTGMGELSGLVYLNLSRNRLSGPIPSDLGRLGGQLQSLDMSFNELVGPIPSSFQNLTSLGVFNVSYNEGLSGSIPLMNPQLNNEDSYIGDPNLCGVPIISNACPTPQLQDGTPSSQDDADHKSRNFISRWIDEWIAVPGLLLGTVVGFLGTLLALKLLKW